MKSFFSSLLGATLFVILLFFPGLVFEGAKMGLNLWFFTLVPTLLPFMVFSNILIQSRLIEHLLFLPGLFTRKYLHLSPAGLYAFLIDPKEASMLFGFCNNVSPAFLITYFLTLHLKHPEKAGITVSFLYIIPAFVCLMAFFFCGSSFSLREKKTSSPVLSLALLDACLQDALSVLLKLGGYIILFSVLFNVITHIPRMRAESAAFFSCFLEITGGIPAVTAAFAYPQSYVILLPFLAFGGLCSFMQTGSVIKDTPLSLRSYFFTKILLALLIFLCEILCITLLPGLF